MDVARIAHVWRGQFTSRMGLHFVRTHNKRPPGGYFWEGAQRYTKGRENIFYPDRHTKNISGGPEYISEGANFPIRTEVPLCGPLAYRYTCRAGPLNMSDRANLRSGVQKRRSPGGHFRDSRREYTQKREGKSGKKEKKRHGGRDTGRKRKNIFFVQQRRRRTTPKSERNR